MERFTNLAQCSRMHTDLSFLGSFGWRFMRPQQPIMVYQRGWKHRNRHSNHAASATYPSRTATWAASKVDSHLYLLLRLLVSFTDISTSSLTQHSTCIISIIRIKFLSITEDITWNNVEAAAWSVTELCSGTICASLPTLRPLVSRHFPSFSSHSRSYAIHEDSRAQMNSHQIHQSRGLEMDGFSGQSIHSSESKEQLHVLESRIVIHTDIGQHVQASAPGNHQTLHHTSIEGGSGPEIVVLGK